MEEGLRTGLGQDHQAVNTSAMGAVHVKPHKCPQQPMWGSSIQIMSLRAGNANVDPLCIAHEEI